MRRKRKKRKFNIKLLAGLLIVILVGINSIMTTDNRLADNSDKENKQEQEQGIEEIVDDSSEKPEEDDNSEAVKPQELLNKDTVQELVKNEEGNFTKAEEVTSGEIAVVAHAAFKGQYVEDGRDELVEGVAAILVKNKSGKFLDLAILVYEIGDETGTFVVSSLPAGKSAWVMEKSKLVINGDETFEHKGSTITYKEDVITATEKLKLSTEGNMMTVENVSGETMKNVVVYYKVKHSDGNYFGGITYVVDFGELDAGESLEKLAGHYSKENSDIVRISWQ